MFIKVEDLTKLLSVKKSTLYSWVSQKLIPCYKICGGPVRFKRDEIEAWVEQFKKAPEERKAYPKGYPAKNSGIDELVRRSIDESKPHKL